MDRPPITALTSDIPDEMILTPLDLATILAVSVHTARDLLSQGKILGGQRIGRLWRIAAGAVRAWLRDETLPKNREIFEWHEKLSGGAHAARVKKARAKYRESSGR